MESDDILRSITLGEDSALELKRVFLAGSRITAPARDDFADELAAFANGRGGTVILGVDDRSRDIIGLPLEQLDAVETWVRDICNDSIKPPIDAEIRKLELPDASGRSVPVVRIDVARSLYVHRSPGGYYRRIGSSKRELAPEILARLFQERSQTRVIRFDESPIPGTSAEHLDLGLAGRFVRGGTDTDEAALRKLRIIADDEDGVTRITIAGALLCTTEPQVWLPHAEIQCVSYAGDRQDVNYQNDARDIRGTLDAQVFDALHFVRRNMQVAAAKSTARIERPQYSERAVFEALVNAVAHRDYSMAGARVRLHMFRDRLELAVPGGLANTLTPDSMAMRQYSRNELVVSLLARCPVEMDELAGRAYLMDRRGDGVPIIIEETTRLSGRPPEYRVIDEVELRLVIWAATSDANESDQD